MNHRTEIDTIIAQVMPWPVEERVALAHKILRDMHGPAPRKTLARALGIASGAATPPDDALVQQWIEERRVQKYG